MRVERLLADCLDDARTEPLGSVPLTAQDDGYPAARRLFLAAGLEALRAHARQDGWVQLDVPCPAPRPERRLYERLLGTAEELLASGRAGDFFFMHKPPGLRIRFRAADRSRVPELCEVLLGRLAPPRHGPAWERPVPRVYEPETYLFGGPRAMSFVHTLFTADSLAWLRVHTAAAGEPAPPAWRVSLMLLRAVCDALGVVGWEHRGVWQAVWEETGRGLSRGLHSPDLRRAAAGIRRYWESGREDRLDALPKAWRDVMEEHLRAVESAARQWHTGCFASGEATLGPRRAAARHAVFHWNRGGLSTARQCLLTEALAADGHQEVG
ncbi:thiopeptide-type bacteriocin biosynthesis protein [Streptomyces thermoviolaceus]|uniref:thiopeptide-type bacteriocin biosynthesis protein n=1 Tax=Streptomyces thermoviolaceus TaxID=1952 RepID=UPI0033A82C81